jgi:hypothetical protein
LLSGLSDNKSQLKSPNKENFVFSTSILSITFWNAERTHIGELGGLYQVTTKNGLE